MGRALVRGLLSRGFDVLTVAEAGRRGLPDDEQLRFAAIEQRVVYTCNVKHFAALHTAWLTDGLHHGGIVVLTRQLTPVGEQIRALTRLAGQITPEMMQDRLEFLGDWME